MLPIAALAHMSIWLGWGRSPESIAATLVFPVVATAAVIAASLALHQVLVRAGGGWLFALPDRCGVAQPRPCGVSQTSGSGPCGTTPEGLMSVCTR